MTDIDRIALVLSLAAIAYGIGRPVGLLVYMLCLTMWGKWTSRY